MLFVCSVTKDHFKVTMKFNYVLELLFKNILGVFYIYGFLYMCILYVEVGIMLTLPLNGIVSTYASRSRQASRVLEVTLSAENLGNYLKAKRTGEQNHIK